MAMINLKEMSLQRGGKILFEAASLQIHSAQRVAIIGVNGCGKSTLFQLLLGKIHNDTGSVELPNNLRIAHMEQEISNVERSARDYILDGDVQLRHLEAAISQAEKQEEHGSLANLHAEMDAIDGYTASNRAETIMLGLGFSSSDYERPVAAFSGGWRIRLNLARTLISNSDLLLLDEPTNHLDIEAIQWLEQWLQQYKGTVLLISHDRDFIDNTMGYIAHIEDLQIHLYKGSYSDFERQRAEKLALQQSTYVKQQQRRAELQRFIDRFKAKATKAKQAQSRIKALEKMQLVSAVREKSAYQFRIPHADKTSSPLINWFQVDIGYEDKAILKSCTFSILPSMRIGLLGENGAGKSTLVKTIAGQKTILSGEAVQSEHLKIGYFAQHQLEALDMQASPILHLQRLSPTVREQEIRDFLGAYRIKGDMATGSIEKFSGGEKARLALAIVAWQKPNLLLLDEPTNHLDIEMREALAEALQAFEGAVVLVSHDRYLLRHCVDEFWLVDQEKIKEFSGDLNDYYQLKATQLTSIENKNEIAKENRKHSRQEAAQLRAKKAPLTKVIKQLENQITKIEQQLQSIAEKLSDTSVYESENKQQLQQLLKDEAAIKKELEQIEVEWFTQQELLAELEV